MISFDEAKSLILNQHLFLEIEEVKVTNALHRMLAQDVFSLIDQPPFDNSAVDGFAINRKSLPSCLNLPVSSQIRAKSQNSLFLPIGTAARIMTGALMPAGADAVVMLEDATIKKNLVGFKKKVVQGENVRKRGEDIEQGACLAKRFDFITPQLIGALLGSGIDKISVFKTPKIKILCTGDELVDAPNPLMLGQVYFLVGPMLAAQCSRMGISDVSIKKVNDRTDSIVEQIKNSFDADILLITGGISRGDYDFVRQALACCDVEEIFYKGKWRPGKPLFFGKRKKTFVFGLPGNPVSSFVCFEMFVKPLIAGAFAINKIINPRLGFLSDDFIKKQGFTIFSRAIVNENNMLSLLPGQGSHQVFSLSKANALCVMPANAVIVKKNQQVTYYPI